MSVINNNNNMTKREENILMQLAAGSITIAKAARMLKCSVLGVYIKGFNYLRNKHETSR